MYYANSKATTIKMHPLPLRHSQPSKRGHVRASNSTEGVSDIEDCGRCCGSPEQEMHKPAWRHGDPQGEMSQDKGVIWQDGEKEGKQKKGFVQAGRQGTL